MLLVASFLIYIFLNLELVLPYIVEYVVGPREFHNLFVFLKSHMSF